MAERCADCGAHLDPRRKQHDCLYARLRASVPAGLDLTEAEDRWLHWLAGFDRDAVDPLVSMLARLRAADRALTDTLLEALRKASPETLHAGIDALIEELNEPFCACGRRRSQCDGSRVGCVSRRADKGVGRE